MMKSMSMKRENISFSVLFCVFFLFLLFVFRAAVECGFVWDDYSFIHENRNIFSLNNIGPIFLRPWCMYYRPMQFLSYCFDYALGGFSPAIFHIINVFLHIVVSYLFMAYVYVVSKDKWFSFLSALIFSIHPLQSGTVFYISNRADLLSAVFLFLMLLSYHFFLKKTNWLLYIASLILFLGALLSKENSFIFPFLLVFHQYLIKKKNNFLHLFPYFIMLLGFIYWRTIVIPSFLESGVGVLGMVERVPGFFVALWRYFVLLIIPHDLHMGYGYFLFSWFYYEVFLGVFVFLLLSCLAYKFRKKTPIVNYAIIWFFICIIPVSNVFFQMSFFMGEQLLYVPFMFFYCLFAYGLVLLYKRKHTILMRCIVVLYVILCAVAISKQGEYWKDERNFYEQTLEAQGDLRVATMLVTRTYLDGDKERAYSLAKQMLDLFPEKEIVYHANISLLLIDAKFDKAENLINNAMVKFPKSKSLYMHSSLLCEIRGDLDEALRLNLIALEIAPDDLAIKDNLKKLENKIYLESGMQ